MRANPWVNPYAGHDREINSYSLHRDGSARIVIPNTYPLEKQSSKQN